MMLQLYPKSNVSPVIFIKFCHIVICCRLDPPSEDGQTQEPRSPLQAMLMKAAYVVAKAKVLLTCFIISIKKQKISCLVD